MAARIRQIAEIARVSPATVSLALNNKPGVSPSTRARILAIADDLMKTNGTQPFTSLIKGSVRFLKIVKHGHTPQSLSRAFAMHRQFIRTGDMGGIKWEDWA